MFDPVTADLVRSAPGLPGLDPAALVDELTFAYIGIAVARLALSGADGQDGADLLDLLDRMGRLADTYEGLIVLGIEGDRRRSAAFVAASARQVMARISRLEDGAEGPSRLDEDAMGADLAAALLFLIAERSSDAFEAARDIRAAGEPNPIRRALILAVGQFARGRFGEVLAIDVASEKLSAEGDVGHATDLLFRELLKGVQLLARSGLGLAGQDAIDAADAVFTRVRQLALDSDTSNALAPAPPLASVSVFAGPHHLAALLRRAGEMLRTSAIVGLPIPGGADPESWTAWLKGEAARWPFLWQNHRLAVATGYLDQGSSLVMTTPTGSGKTTLAALKIAATLAAGKTVLYLAPTHALVGQVERDLNERVAGLAKAVSIDDAAINETVQNLPDLAVVTPERCFALLTFAPELFKNVGLLVFDECHLLSVAKPATPKAPPRVGRRGVDAMLCLLTFMNVNASADYLLLSAMVSNGEEIAAWLRGLLGRPVVAFEDRWKPTRQLRSCVTYHRDDLFRLTGLVASGAPEASLRATPYGLFSLSSGWNPDAADKLVLRSFSAAPLPLKKGQGLWLTSNRNEVAAWIAEPFARAGLKVIVFCETITMCGSVAKVLNKGHPQLTPRYTDDQRILREAILSEVGTTSAVYDAGARRAAVHHGELLPAERQLVEGLFRDKDSGVNILAATSTLAQGLNLPCEVVILAGTDRLDDTDPEEKTRTSLMPHEILNAMGRAGRAGLAATGLSIVVPGKPIGFDPVSNWMSDETDLKVVFADGDQCLPLSDPLTTLFDEIEIYGVASEDAHYLLRRLALSVGDEREGVETLERLARRSFGYHRMSAISVPAAESWLTARRDTLTAAIKAAAPQAALPGQEELAARTGATSAFIAGIATAVGGAPVTAVDAWIWMDWLLDQLDPALDDFDAFLRPDTMTRVFGRSYSRHLNPIQRREAARAGIRVGLRPWLGGEPLTALEAALSAFVAAHEGPVARPTKPDKMAKRARRFAMRLAPDLGFLCGVLSQVAEKMWSDAGLTAPPMTGFLPTLIRRGFQTPYHFALAREAFHAARPAVEVWFEGLSADLSQDPADTWLTVRDKLSIAQAKQSFEEITPEQLEAFLSAVRESAITLD